MNHESLCQLLGPRRRGSRGHSATGRMLSTSEPLILVDTVHTPWWNLLVVATYMHELPVTWKTCAQGSFSQVNPVLGFAAQTLVGRKW